MYVLQKVLCSTGLFVCSSEGMCDLQKVSVYVLQKVLCSTGLCIFFRRYYVLQKVSTYVPQKVCSTECLYVLQNV